MTRNILQINGERVEVSEMEISIEDPPLDEPTSPTEITVSIQDERLSMTVSDELED